ncbi:MAG: hypothetical protein WBM32_06730, partial [Crocosphaera sp.]
MSALMQKGTEIHLFYVKSPMAEISLNLEQEAINENTSPERLGELAQTNDTLAYLVAKNPNTNPETLTKLAKSENSDILKAVIKNPNISDEAILKLGIQFPQEFNENPILDLYLLEDGEIAWLSDEAFWLTLADCYDTPKKVWELLFLANLKTRYKYQDILDTVFTHFFDKLLCPMTLLELFARYDEYGESYSVYLENLDSSGFYEPVSVHF